jgi:ABC-type lipoprotein export system ATPase subunit
MEQLYNIKNMVINNSEDLSLEFGEFSFKKNVITVIKGNSGIGKTTILKVLGLLAWNVAKETEIHLSLDGKPEFFPLHKLNWKQKQKIREKHFAYIFQDDHLVDALSVEDNIIFPSMLIQNGKNDTDLRQKIETMLEHDFLKAIKGRLNNSCSILSGGEKKKVSLLRAMLKNPDVLIADEPWTNLGKNPGRDDVADYIGFFIQQRKGKSTILATHHLESIAKFKEYDFVEIYRMEEREHQVKQRKIELVQEK